MSLLVSTQVIVSSGVVFGTSGARGLVTQFTPDVCAAFAHAFVDVMKREFQFTRMALAIDNRPSSYHMAMVCSSALMQAGVEPVYYGVIPTPALAYQAMQDEIPGIMVTGSHIPFDRNGLKFYRPDGEITKADETAIVDNQAIFEPLQALPELDVNSSAAQSYLTRYLSLFDASLMVGKRIGIYEHSSAGRDLYSELFSQFGAEVISLERSDEFVPIDTEAVSAEDRKKAKTWVAKYRLDAIFSTDGDGDRPLISDETGEWLRGDILGLLTASALNIEALAIPVSCNTAVELSDQFKAVERTKIGSPYVIAEFTNLADRFVSVAGFEANGGFLLGNDVVLENGKILKALPTRDALLPAIILFAASKDIAISELVARLPQRFTHSDRIKNFPKEVSQKLLTDARQDMVAFLDRLGLLDQGVEGVDETDGLRITMKNQQVIHLRPSGNAPELRCYAEADSVMASIELVGQVLKKIPLL